MFWWEVKGQLFRPARRYFFSTYATACTVFSAAFVNF
jgi:hypothetical protein